MSSWKEFRLDEFGELQNHKRIPLSSMERANRKGIYPYYGASGVIDHIDNYIFEGEYVLISEDGENLKSRNTPIAFIASGKFWVNNHAHIFKGNNDFNNKLIVYYLQNLDLNPYLTGAVQPKLNKASLLSIPFLLPSDENEQAAIISMLSCLDDKIDLLHRQNATLEKMAETLFRQWFVEEVQEEWEEGNIYRLIDVVYGFPFKSKYFNEEKNGLPLIRIRDLKEGNSNVYTFEECDSKYIVNNGDLIAGMDGEFRLYIWSGVKSVLNQRACKFLPKYDYVPELYIFSLMKPYLYYYENTKVGTTVIHLGKADLNDIKISIPPKDLLIEYGKMTNNWFLKLKNNNVQIRTLTALRDTLLPKLMSGDVRVV